MANKLSTTKPTGTQTGTKSTGTKSTGTQTRTLHPKYMAAVRKHTYNRAANGENVLGKILTSPAYRRDEQQQYPSAHPADKPGVVAVKPTYTQYTGNAVLGIAHLHKSNYIPVTTGEQATDVARMRRN